jgi:hypothetical protein
MRLCRIAVFIAIGLLGTSGGYAGDPSKASSAKSISKAGYFVFSVVLLVIILVMIYICSNVRMLGPRSVVVSDAFQMFRSLLVWAAPVCESR